MAFIYPNNWAWPGRTAFIYNITLNTFFDGESGEKLSDYTTLSDIGFEYKLHSASSWNTYSIVKEGNDLDTINDLIDTVTDKTEPVVFERFKPQYGHIYPCKVVVKGLSVGLVYDVRSYYKKGTAKTNYNSQTIELLNGNPGVVCTGINIASTIDTSVPANAQSIQTFEDTLADSLEILNMFMIKSYEFPINIVDTYQIIGSWAEWGRKSFAWGRRGLWNDYELLFYTFIHEIGHDVMQLGEGSSAVTTFSNEGSIKFMEFATFVPNAYWTWAGRHNYPWLNDRNSYVGNCLAAAAYQVSSGE